MSLFPRVVDDYWNARFRGHVVHADTGFALTINAALDDDRRVMVLERDDGAAAVVTPSLADTLDLLRSPTRSLAAFRQRLRQADVSLHGADRVFYCPAAPLAPRDAPSLRRARRLVESDHPAFAEFHRRASAQDLDDAFVEWDHWAVFGVFDDDRLVGAASAYPWGDAPIADLGVLTLASHRGRGYARDLVRAIARHAIERGHLPQYRCQIDNSASLALAHSAGLMSYGCWEVVSPG